MRHLSGDKDKLVADDSRHKARSRRRGDPRRMDLADLVARLRHDRDQRSRYRRPRAETAFHHHRGAWRDVVGERVVPGKVIGGDGPRVRIVLIEPDGVREVGAEFAEHSAHPPQNEICLPPALVLTEKREARRPKDRLVHPARLPIIGLVAGQKDPGPGLYRTGKGNRRTQQVVDRSYLQRHGSALIGCRRDRARLPWPRWANR